VIVVADRYNDRIRLVTPEGVVSTLAGSGVYGFADGLGTAASFRNPFGVAVLPNGVVVVADTDNQRIRLITPEGLVSTLAGGAIANPTGPAASPDYADGTASAARFGYPCSVAVLPNGMIAVADSNNHRVRLVNSTTGDVTTLAGSTSGYADGTGSAARFRNLYGVAVLPNELIAVGDRDNHRIRLVNLAGDVTTLAGSGSPGTADGVGTAASFNTPNGIAVLPSSSLIVVADAGNHLIRLVSPTGIVTTLAGGLPRGDANGTGPAAKFNLPNSVAVVPSTGGIVVADATNNRIRHIAGAF
jgi:glucose/arabinose dehydrogenase